MAALTHESIVHLQHQVMFALTVQPRTARNRSQDEAKQMAYVNSTRAASGSIADRLTAAVATVKSALVRRRMFSQTFRELNGLTERELSDLGIHRSMIRQIAAEAAYGK
jgi:uncharacterized protein YjiS (DUF1127 family)